MNLTLDHAAVWRTLPRTWEFFRAVSGLTAIAALALVVINLPAVAEPGLPAVINSAPANQTLEAPDATSRPPVLLSLPDRHRVMVFYLVASREQEAFADNGEHIRGMEAYIAGHPVDQRDYQILYASTREQEHLAGQAIVDAMIETKDAALFEVIDLRGVEAGDM